MNLTSMKQWKINCILSGPDINDSLQHKLLLIRIFIFIANPFKHMLRNKEKKKLCVNCVFLRKDVEQAMNVCNLMKMLSLMV